MPNAPAYLHRAPNRAAATSAVAVADALADLVADRHSTMCHDFDAAANVMKELLFDNPAAVHSIPV